MVFNDVQIAHYKLFILDGNDAVQIFLEIREDDGTRGLDCSAVCDGVGRRQCHYFPCFKGSLEAGSSGGLDTDDLDLRIQQLSQGGHACGEPASAHGNQNVVHQRQILEDLHGYGSLACGNSCIVERMYEGIAFFLRQFKSVFAGLVIYVSVKNDLSTVALGAVHLDEGCGGGHDDHSFHSVCLGSICYALGVVSGGSRDKASFAFFL